MSEKKIRGTVKRKASQVEGSKCVATSNLTSYEEIFLPEFGGAISNTRSPYCGSVEGDLSGLIDSNGIKVESLQRQTREMNQPVHDRWLPFSETILHGSELGQLTIPIRMNTKGLHITVLVEVRTPTAICLDGDCGAIVLPECREDARSVMFVADLSKGFSDATSRIPLALTLKSRYRWKFHG